MSIFVKASAPVAAKNIWATRVAIGFAGLLVVMIVAQLYSFEHFLLIMRDFALPGGVPASYFLAAFIVAAELLALPFLLRMQLSIAMRWLSMVLGWLVAATWLGIIVFLMATESTVTNSGLMGDVVAIAPGVVSVIWALALVVLASISAWGMWPARPKNARR